MSSKIVIDHPSVVKEQLLAVTAQAPSTAQLVVPGEAIAAEAGFMKGHGTQVVDGVLISTICGVVDRVNKLISVLPLKTRYQGDVGDVVVARVVEVSSNRWKVDIHARQNGVLMLSSINLPGGVQRRRTEQDELQMRNYFEEGDLISAEVQQFFNDGSISLHTRSAKYGKLKHGQFLSVAPSLVRRCKSHFHSLPCGIDVIFGNNGHIWISPTPPDDEAAATLDLTNITEVSLGTREAICRVRNALEALDRVYVAIDRASVCAVYDASLDMPPKDMLKPSNIVQITADARKMAQGTPDEPTPMDN